LPTCNREEYLDRAARSLLAQDYPADRFEIIVVDNGSADGTLARVRSLAQEAKGKVNLTYAREDRPGLVFGRHTGAALAKGEILLFGDDDAVFDGNWISAVVDVYLSHPEVAAVGTRIEVRWDLPPQAWVHSYEGVLGKLDYGSKTIVQIGLHVNGGSFAIRKDILRQVHGFNPGQRGDYIVGDSETGLCRKLASAGIPVGWTPAATMWHLQRAQVNGTLGDLKRRYRNNGICDAYHATYYGWRTYQVAIDAGKKTYRVLRRCLRAICKNGREPRGYDVALESSYYFHYLKYLWLYRFHREIRNEVMGRDWEFTENYRTPSVVHVLCHYEHSSEVNVRPTT
jgi:glycosyltransferase involved in cell wall biosynthesis